ncbi:MAG TPA: hypothetical protein VFG69_14425 [Nannocystaceae bacterium]|nr:hypothetical protein [Nannocystaceae bacterium]
MDSTKAELESVIRLKRARLDRKLAKLERRVDEAKETGKLVGIIASSVVVVAAVGGMIAMIVRGVLARRRRKQAIVLFGR